MKRFISLVICMVMVSVLAGCGSKQSDKTGSKPAGVSDVLEQGMAQADGKKEEVAPAPDPSGSSGTGAKQDVPADDIDVDLTVLSSTMVYSEVYNMMSSPEDYIGKTVKMDGLFAIYHDEAADVYYFACIVKDATACCAQGIEFVLAGDYKYPDDYPPLGEEIAVVGVFDTYEEGSNTYCTLRNARLL